MSWYVAGATVISAVMTYDSQGNAIQAQTDASNASLALDKQNLDFQMQRYQDWKDVYGNLQEDLGTYYSNLTGDSKLPDELANIERASQQAQKAVDTTLAQRGIETSGLSAQTAIANEVNTAEQKALASNTIESRVNAEKASFLGLGLGQGNSIANTVGNSYTQSSANIRNNALATNNLNLQQTDSLATSVGVAGATASAYYNSGSNGSTNTDYFNRTFGGN